MNANPNSRGVIFGLTLLALFLAVDAGLSIHNVRKLHEDARWVAHTYEVLDTIDDLRAGLESVAVYRRSYLLTGARQFVESYAAEAGDLGPKVELLRELTLDNPAQQSRIPQLRVLISARINSFEHDLRGGDPPQTPPSESMLEADDVPTLLLAMETDERQLLADRQRTTTRTYTIALASGLLAGVLGLATLAMFVWLLQRHLRSRATATAIIREQQQLLEATLTSIGDGVIVTDEEARITFLNPVAENLTAWSLAEATGASLLDVFKIVNETTREAVDNPALRALHEGLVVGLANHTILVAKDGTERPIDDSAAPIRDAEGMSIGAVLVFRDVTERRRAGEEAEASYSENVRLYKELREVDNQKDAFLATLAHELRNPLAPVRNSLEIMKRAGGDADLMERARDTMERQVVQMVRLVDDLLDVSRITRNKLELRRERTELSTVVRNAVETSRPLVDARGQRLAIHLPQESVFLDADPTRLAQVLSNLLNNSAKYTDRGGRIDLTATVDGSDVVVTVKDDGVGIPAEMLPHIFDMFTQVDRSLERSQGGLGIGLTLVRQLVEMHGGMVEAHSAGAGQGSKFVVRLPRLADQASESAIAVAPDGGGARAARRILIVDDNQDSAESLALFLKLMGNDVRVAHDGREGVSEAEAFRPAVILMDIGLPEMNGYEAARMIREQEWGASLVLIAVTGWGQEEDRRRSTSAGFDHHLVKPVDPADLQVLLDGLGE